MAALFALDQGFPLPIVDVLDEYTGARRPTKTLSGGETFLASLSLALALADQLVLPHGRDDHRRQRQ